MHLISNVDYSFIKRCNGDKLKINVHIREYFFIPLYESEKCQRREACKCVRSCNRRPILFLQNNGAQQLASEATVYIMLEDVNDEIPLFTEREQETVLEGEPVGSKVTQVNAIDKDGTFPNNQVNRYQALLHSKTDRRIPATYSDSNQLIDISQLFARHNANSTLLILSCISFRCFLTVRISSKNNIHNSIKY